MIRLRNGLFVLLGAMLLVAALAGCSSTAHLSEKQYLLRRNTVQFKTTGIVSSKGELKDNLYRVIVQRPNTYRGVLVKFPPKLWHYNYRYEKLHNKPDSLLPKAVERPVVLDSIAIQRSIIYMRSYLFNQGYFYAKVSDTVINKRKKAFVVYRVTSGINYLINNVQYDADDSAIAKIVQEASAESVLKKNKSFSNNLGDEERSRVVSLLRNKGYYHFSLDNVRIELDTLDKAFLKDVENPLESALNFMALARNNTKRTLDAKVFIRTNADTTGIPYKINAVNVYPDHESVGVADSDALHIEKIDSLVFSYLKEYVHARVLADRIYLRPGALFAESNQDKTVAKLNELGVFQYIRIQILENRRDSLLNVNIFLSRTKKLDLFSKFEVSNGSTYLLGNSLAVGFRNTNFARGANLLSVSANYGVELGDSLRSQSLKRFSLLTQYYGANGSLDFPKFIAPVPKYLFDNSNLPHTILSAGFSIINRVQYFTLTNSTASYKYNWRASQAHIWEFAPVFVNIFRIRNLSQSFQDKLANSAFLRNSYKEIFNEGESLGYTYSNIEKKKGRNYYRIKLAFEESGGLLTLVRSFSPSLIDINKNPYGQYVKFDFDIQRFVTLPHSLVALRFYGGVGLPNGRSTALPYVKQYYVGGPYGLRGWRMRTLGPSSFYDSASAGKLNTIDRTGDIKLEFNGEFRFPIVPLLAGVVKMNGAIFTDAGNIWLANPDSTLASKTSHGEFSISNLGQDIAMDVGAGARFDIASFLTFRIDLAMPVKKPYQFGNLGWVIDEIDFKNPTWRANNLVLNLSIGYPF